MANVTLKVHEFTLGRFNPSENSFENVRVQNFLELPDKKTIETYLIEGEEVIRRRKVPINLVIPNEVLEQFM